MYPIQSPVSIPYRRSTNTTGAAVWKKTTPVSIPYRRSTNSAKEIFFALATSMFQFLIGDLQTAPTTTSSTIPQPAFQFLIGDLQTI